MSQSFPPGLVGSLASYIYNAAPYPNATVALAGAIGLVSGLCGRSYNISGTGLNQYVLILAATGVGKEAAADGIGRVMSSAQQSVKAAGEFRGPGEIASAPGLHRWLAKLANPAMFVLIGEIGLKLKAITAPNANSHETSLKRALLQLWGKSGHGNVFDAAAYADKDNNIAPIAAPSLTLLGESTPETLFGILDESMISSGLLSRFLIFETDEPRPYENRNRVIPPCPQLISSVADIAAQALNIASQQSVHNVEMTDEARARFLEFSDWTTDQINAGNDTIRHLWNRAHLKSLKLAATVAVGRDPYNPRITLDECMWATGLVVGQTRALMSKFESGNVGEQSTSDKVQQDKVRKVIREWLETPWDKLKTYKVSNEDVHRHHVVPWSWISKRLTSDAAFRTARPNATAAIRTAVKELITFGEIVRVANKNVPALSNSHAEFFAASEESDVFGGALKQRIASERNLRNIFADAPPGESV